MRITRNATHIVVRCTPSEFEILERAIEPLEIDGPADRIPEEGLRRTWGRRVAGGPFLRIDRDKRPDNVR